MHFIIATMTMEEIPNAFSIFYVFVNKVVFLKIKKLTKFQVIPEILPQSNADQQKTNLQLLQAK
jgi:hypothetical protein